MAYGLAVGADDDRAGATVVVLGGNGSMRNVQRIAIGSVPDTQRRRRNALKETYHTLEVY